MARKMIKAAAADRSPKPARSSEAKDAASGQANSLRGDIKLFTRQRILEAALQCFRRSGFRLTTVEQIANVAGMTVPTFYRYFSSKDDLIPPLQDHLQGEVQAVLRQLDSIDYTDRSVVRQWFDSYIVMWSRVHRLCEAFWEASALHGANAKNVWSDTLETISVLKNFLGGFQDEDLKRAEARIGMFVLFMDRAALLVVAEDSTVRAKLIADEFSAILWEILNRPPTLDGDQA